MTSSLSNLINNLSKEIHKTKCKNRHEDKKVTLRGLNVSIATDFLNKQILEMIWWNTNVCVVTKTINTSLIKT